MVDEGFFEINRFILVDAFAQSSDFANLLTNENLTFLVSIYSNSYYIAFKKTLVFVIRAQERDNLLQNKKELVITKHLIYTL